MLGIIYSFDRAIQLDALLRSFYLHCKDPESANLIVIYKTSDEMNYRQYAELIREYSQPPGFVQFLEQEDFRWDTIRSLLSLIPGSLKWHYHRSLHKLGHRFGRLSNLWLGLNKDDLVLFLVDDNLFTHEFCLNEIFQKMKQHPEAIGFSLRLGENIRFSYTSQKALSVPKFDRVNEKTIRFDWTTSEGYFGYPLEISSSIYRLKEIMPIINHLPFENPNRFEGYLALHSNDFREKHPKLLSFAHSVAFCNPINKVQTFNDNLAGSQLKYSANNLAKLFDAGYRINIADFSGFLPNACHQEIEFTLEQMRVSQ